MKTILGCAALAIAMSVASPPADAKGCIKGAVVGGVAGHFADHYAVAGAVAGCGSRRPRRDCRMIVPNLCCSHFQALGAALSS